MKPAGFVMALALLSAFMPEKATLDITITGLHENKGVIRISVYTAPDQYPYQPWRTYTVTKDSLREGVLHTVIDDLEPGLYGLCMLDDENESGQMDNNFLGLPAEGFAFANNVRPFLKKPDYSQIQFRLLPGFNHIDLITRYKT